MSWTLETAPDKVRDMDEARQGVWIHAANRAADEGYDEAGQQAIAFTAAKIAELYEVSPGIIYDYPLERPGKYVAAVGSEFEIEPEDVLNTARAIAMLYDKGLPVSLIDGHGSDGFVGFIPAARVDGDTLRGALVLRDWYMYTGIEAGAFGLSQEADLNYASEAYTDGETFRFWPTAWAVLPAGQQPAIPPGESIAASTGSKSVRLYAAEEQAPDGGNSPTGKGDEGMDELKQELEQLKAAQQEQAEKLTALEAQNGELTEKLTAAEQERDQLRSEKEAAELEAEEKAVSDRAEAVLAAEARPGARERMRIRLEAAEGVAAKKALIDAWEISVGEDEIKAAKLRAAEAKPDQGVEDKGDRLEAAADKRSKDKGISYMRALEEVINEQRGT